MEPIVEQRGTKGAGSGGDMDGMDLESGMLSQLHSGSATPNPNPLPAITTGGGMNVRNVRKEENRRKSDADKSSTSGPINNGKCTNESWDERL